MNLSVVAIDHILLARFLLLIINKNMRDDDHIAKHTYEIIVNKTHDLLINLVYFRCIIFRLHHNSFYIVD